ncbi:LysE family translocator [uncultured Sulfitobacter sp.]|uniref:LysE family translocator n=1 Tax=uncultured Sulfitobacter sp. TaxID=191468 RepID=UPI00262B4448|nr:LysE family translocator [uncultured Sulfitobacter sp.]
MDPVLFFSFIAATALIVGLPGPSCALASAQAVRYGNRAAALTISGDALGSAVHIVIAVASLQALIGLAEFILPFLQIAGGLFVVYLGWKSFTAPATSPEAPPQGSGVTAFWAGFFACVTNPKAIVFFIALFPGFISPEHSIIVQSLIYGAVFITLDAASIWAYAMLARRLVLRASGRINIDKLSGLGLIGVGALLVVKGIRASQPA